MNTLDIENTSVNSVLSDARRTLTQAQHHILYTADSPHNNEVDTKHHTDLETTVGIPPEVHMLDPSLSDVAGSNILDNGTSKEFETELISDPVTLVDDSKRMRYQEEPVHVSDHTVCVLQPSLHNDDVKLTLDKMIMEHQVVEDQLTTEQQERGVIIQLLVSSCQSLYVKVIAPPQSALDALIEDNQRRHREKKQIMVRVCP